MLVLLQILGSLLMRRITLKRKNEPLYRVEVMQIATVCTHVMFSSCLRSFTVLLLWMLLSKRGRVSVGFSVPWSPTCYSAPTDTMGINEEPSTAYWKALSEKQPTNASALFRLGTALYEQDDIPGAVKALEKTAALERIQVAKHNVPPSNLLLALRTLASFLFRLDLEDDCLRVLDEQQYWISRQMPFAWEKREDEATVHSELEHICSSDRRVASRTTSSIMSSQTIDRIRDAVGRYREQSSNIAVNSRRFTMQYAGNTDFHLADICAEEPELRHDIDQVLQTAVYPLVRESFANVSSCPLCIYDALVVQYDASGAKKDDQKGASLPLHRDGGLYSVNIALNSGFIGGGTFFDHLLTTLSPKDCILKPRAPGQAVVHRGTERHAGAKTTSGVREILVFFLTSTEVSPVERSRHIREMTDDSSMMLMANQLAARMNPDDAEAHFWSGLHLLQPDSLPESIAYLEHAAQLCPTSSQTFLYLGIAYSKREELAKAKRAFERVLVLEDAYNQVGFGDSNVADKAMAELKNFTEVRLRT